MTSFLRVRCLSTGAALDISLLFNAPLHGAMISPRFSRPHFFAVFVATAVLCPMTRSAASFSASSTAAHKSGGTAGSSNAGAPNVDDVEAAESIRGDDDGADASDAFSTMAVGLATAPSSCPSFSSFSFAAAASSAQPRPRQPPPLRDPPRPRSHTIATGEL